MINIKNDLDFFVPIDTMKSGTSENKKVAIVSGWASTGDRDFQGEIIEPIGIDASYLFNNGWIDYEHDTELPVGLPTENSYVDPEKGLYLETAHEAKTQVSKLERQFNCVVYTLATAVGLALLVYIIEKYL